MTAKSDLYVFNMPGMIARLVRSVEKMYLMMKPDYKIHGDAMSDIFKTPLREIAVVLVMI